MEKNKNGLITRREFAFVLYPESVTENWKEILISLQQPIFYILHDKDKNADGTLKKAHYHVMIMYDNPRRSTTVAKIALKCGGSGYLEDLVSKRGYVRYLTHLDNPEKYQYSTDDVFCLCGADYNFEIKSKSEIRNDKLKQITEIMDFCDDNKIHVYSDLLRYSSRYRLDWLDVLTTYSGQVIKDFIKSNAYAYVHPEYKLNRFFDKK